MDDLLREFLTETGEHLDVVDVELVRFEQNPSDAAILRNIFRLVHTIKGTCGFLNLPRLEALAHAAETLMGRLRDGMPVTSEAVTLILSTVDRIKMILQGLDRAALEPDGSDADIIGALEEVASLCVPADMSGTIAAFDLAAPAAATAMGHDAALPEDVPHAAALPVPDSPGRSRDLPTAPAPLKPHTIRVAVDTLERLMTMVSELVLTRNQLLDIARRSEHEGAFEVPLQRLSHVTAELQDGIMKTRMQPIGSAWAKLPRVVRDLAAELGKPIDLVMTGAETELDRQVLELIRDPLTHMVRNSADHGIETPHARILAGKAPSGTIRLNAFHEGGTITIELTDDGGGIDHEAVRRRAAELGLASAADLARMGHDQIAAFIFQPGFSTSQDIGSVSGRGVGMDVVRANLAPIGGSIDVVSETGKGTSFTIKIPLTLAIVAALIVKAGGQRFAIPQVAVMELIRVAEGSAHILERIDGRPLLRLRDELLPVVEIAERLALNGGAGRADAGFIVVAQVGRQRFGMLVDAVLETEEIVVKPMSSRLRHLHAFSGNTILGDGAVILIIDPNGIARDIGADYLRGTAGIDAAPRPDDSDERDVTILLVFRSAVGAQKAVPLSLVTRLEEVAATAIETVGGERCIQYRGQLMPLIDIDGSGSIVREGRQPLIVIQDGDRLLALAVREIVDVVEERIAIEPVPGRPDLIGSAIVRGRATEIVDIAEYLPRAIRPASREAASGKARHTILLVDDNPFFRNMLSPVLRAAGYRVSVAASLQEAKQVLVDRRIDMLVTDLDLAGGGGLDLVAAIRNRPGAPSPIVVLLASAPSAFILDRARDLGVFDVVAKFDRSGLLAALAEAETDAELAA